MNEWWKLTAEILAGVVLMGGAFAAIRRWISPALKLSARVAEVEKHDKRDMKKFDEIDTALGAQKASDQAIMKALYAILSHELDGNGVDKLRSARDTLTNYIIDK